MVTTRGSVSSAGGPERPRLGDDEIHDLITTHVILAVREAIPKVFQSIKTILIEIFGESYVVFHEVAAIIATATIIDAGLQGGGCMLYWEFVKTNPQSSMG